MWVSSRYLYVGLSFALPFFLVNVLVAIQPELVLSYLRPEGYLTGYEQVLVLTLIALIGVGGLVALLPIMKDKRLYIVNAIVGVAFIALALFLGYPLGKDFYHCNILDIPNCD